MEDEITAPGTVGQLIERCAARLAGAGLSFGHGTDNARDEAAALVLYAAGLDPQPGAAGGQAVPAAARRWLAEALRQRIEQRRPVPYITGEAWFAGLRFSVDERVLIPRSPFAELIEARFEPWLRPGPVTRILDVGTGSGCLAVALALAFPGSRVVATDLSADALAVARVNRHDHGLDARLALVQTDLLAGLRGPFDLIVSNPPYVPEGERAELPAEYAHEPALGLFSGPDGLASPARILQDALPCLAEDGLLALEVGAGWPALEAAFPRLPMVWPELERGGEGIALIEARELRGLAARS